MLSKSYRNNDFLSLGVTSGVFIPSRTGFQLLQTRFGRNSGQLNTPVKCMAPHGNAENHEENVEIYWSVSVAG